jgi:hypothetical protein
VETDINTAVIRGQTGEAWEPENQIKLFGCREVFGKIIALLLNIHRSVHRNMTQEK